MSIPGPAVTLTAARFICAAIAAGLALGYPAAIFDVVGICMFALAILLQRPRMRAGLALG